jgi:HEAT repeat protein
MLELLADEKDRSVREFLLATIKELGKNQMMLIGEHLSDDRWYFVRNIVSILGESKTDHVLAFLHRVANHDNIRIREEVIKGLISIGGKKSAALLSRFLQDREQDIQLMAIRGLVDMPDGGLEPEASLMSFLENRPLKQKTQLLTIEAIAALGKIGAVKAQLFLVRYTRTRWWRSRKLQAELRNAAMEAITEIKWRENDARRAK